MEPVYLGDGVFATFDGYHIEIRVGAHRNPPVVFLEAAVMEQPIQYHERIKQLRRQAYE